MRRSRGLVNLTVRLKQATGADKANSGCTEELYADRLITLYTSYNTIIPKMGVFVFSLYEYLRLEVILTVKYNISLHGESIHVGLRA